MTLGQKIKKMREDRALTVEEFAEKIGEKQEDIILLEQDRLFVLKNPDYDMLNKIAEVLEMTIEDVFDIDTPEMAKAIGVCKAEVTDSGSSQEIATGDISRIGQCIYCGQQAMVTCNAGISQEAVNEFVTRQCSCEGAKALKRKEEAAEERLRKIEAAEYNAEALFEGYPGAIEIIKTAVPYLVDCTLKKVSVSIDSGLSVMASRDTYGKVTIEKRQIIVDSVDSE